MVDQFDPLRFISYGSQRIGTSIDSNRLAVQSSGFKVQGSSFSLQSLIPNRSNLKAEL